MKSLPARLKVDLFWTPPAVSVHYLVPLPLSVQRDDVHCRVHQVAVGVEGKVVVLPGYVQHVPELKRQKETPQARSSQWPKNKRSDVCCFLFSLQEVESVSFAKHGSLLSSSPLSYILSFVVTDIYIHQLKSNRLLPPFVKYFFLTRRRGKGSRPARLWNSNFCTSVMITNGWQKMNHFRFGISTDFELKIKNRGWISARHVELVDKNHLTQNIYIIEVLCLSCKSFQIDNIFFIKPTVSATKRCLSYTGEWW